MSLKCRKVSKVWFHEIWWCWWSTLINRNEASTCVHDISWDVSNRGPKRYEREVFCNIPAKGGLFAKFVFSFKIKIFKEASDFSRIFTIRLSSSYCMMIQEGTPYCVNVNTGNLFTLNWLDCGNQLDFVKLPVDMNNSWALWWTLAEMSKEDNLLGRVSQVKSVKR